MYQLPRKNKGAVLTAENWNNSVDAIQDALKRTSDFNSMLPSLPSSGCWAGGRYIDDKGGFSLRSMTKTGDTWTAYFNPGRVVEIHAGGCRFVIPDIDGRKITATPYPGLKAEKGKVYLDLIFGDQEHDCITEAKISTKEQLPSGKVVRMVLGEFVAGDGGSGAAIDDLTYTSFLTGCITYANGSRSEGWRVLSVPDQDGAADKTYVRQGDIYVEGKLAKEGTGDWEEAPAAEGDIWLNVTLDSDGSYQSHSLATEKGEENPAKATKQKKDDSGNDEEEGAAYSFKIAKVQSLPEPWPLDGNNVQLVSVRQYALGAVYCLFARGDAQEGGAKEDGNEGFRVKVEKDATGKVTAVKVRPGHVYFQGRFCTAALEAGPDGWVSHVATSGAVWLVVQFDEWGVFQSSYLSTSQPSIATLTPFILSPQATGIKGQYAFHLADVDTNGTVKQYALGAVYCIFDAGTYFAPGPAE
ncbi:hypothetical protein [Akkermansia sp.]|uniref:hypothetical protein n=1 Tax=Akkermansia sp. TaxID=1872421 RepID=UPI0025BB9182|nr:hypothetical protein [Akkermansia sp.]MCC8149082.1 hypothetical protein [Akkermansia sp.]